MISSPNVSKMYFDLYLHTNVLIDGLFSNSAGQGKVFDCLFHLFCPFVNLYFLAIVLILLIQCHICN